MLLVLLPLLFYELLRLSGVGLSERWSSESARTPEGDIGDWGYGEDANGVEVPIYESTNYMLKTGIRSINDYVNNLPLSSEDY